MPKYGSVKTLLVNTAVSGSGFVESLALDHAPLTRMVSLGTISSGLRWVMVEKSPPFLAESGCAFGIGAFWTGAFWTGVSWTGWMLCPQATHDTNRQSVIRKAAHLHCINFSSS